MKNKIMTISFVGIIFSIFFLNIFIKDKDLSYTERRHLSKFPSISYDNIMSGKFMDKFESYTLDQFIGRDSFRKVKALTEFNIFRKKDNNNIFIKDDYIFKLEYPLNEKKVNTFINKINNVYNNYLKDMNVYFSIIPDKNYFLPDNYLKLDYEKMFNMVSSGLNNMKYIDITDSLTLDDYYLSDTHFKQDRIDEVVEKLASVMHFSYQNNYEKHEYYPFYGVYYGQSAIGRKADTITYLTNDTIDNALVKDYDSDLKTVYEVSSLGKMDSYDVFLSGATPFVEITNTKSKTDKELIIFRDSFGSTLAPLLLDGYAKITLVDLRYMPSNMLTDYIEFKDQDVLIIYSALLINNSDAIKG